MGIRVNLVAAGPVRTMAAKSIPGFAAFENAWDGRAPLGWDVNNPEPVARTRLPAVQLGIPLLCGLSIAHGFLPPHPSPVALIKVFGADTGLTLIYGLIVGGVTLMVAGPLLALTLAGVAPRGADRAPESVPAAAGASGPLKSSGPPTSFGPAETSGASEARLPHPFNSCFTALAPVILIAAATAVAYIRGGPPQLKAAITFIGQPTVALMLSLIYATLTLGVARGMSLKTIMQGYGESLQAVAAILLVLAGAGALKQVFVDSGVNTELAVWLQTVPVHPLILGWLIAMAIRVALGSATIAGLTAAGIMVPIVGISHVNPNLMVLAIGAGSLMCSHVNDAGFWLFKEYFNLDLRNTFRSWTLMESVAGIVGLVCVLGLNLILSL